MHTACLQKAWRHDAGFATCCADGCHDDLRIPSGINLLGATGDTGGADAVDMPTYLQHVRTHPVVQQVVAAAVADANASSGSSEAPVVTRPCCSMPLNTSFTQCCTLTCTECESLYCGVCFKQFISINGDRRSEGIPAGGDHDTSEVMHAHIRECFRIAGVDPCIFAVTDLHHNVIKRGWSACVLSQFLKKRPAFEEVWAPDADALVDNMRTNQRMELIRLLGYAVESNISNTDNEW